MREITLTVTADDATALAALLGLVAAEYPRLSRASEDPQSFDDVTGDVTHLLGRMRAGLEAVRPVPVEYAPAYDDSPL